MFYADFFFFSCNISFTKITLNILAALGLKMRGGKISMKHNDEASRWTKCLGEAGAAL